MERDVGVSGAGPVCALPHGAADGAGVSIEALAWYARGFGLGSINVDTFAEDDKGTHGPVRAALTRTSIILPPSTLDSDARGLANATLAHAFGHLRYSASDRPVEKRKPLLVAMLSLIEDARVERLMMRDYPGLRALWGRFHRASAVRYAEGLSFAALAARLGWALHDPAYIDLHHWVNKGRELFYAACRDLHEVVHFEEAAAILANDLGQMRVRLDASSYQVEPPYRDDNSFLWRFDETEPVNVARTESGELSGGAELGTSDEADLRNFGATAQQEVVTRLYPEWNYRTETLREDWVTVVEGAAPLESPASAGQQHTLRPSSGPSQRLQPRWRQTFSARRLKRQIDGDDFDLDALIEHMSARRGKREPDGRVYTRAGREPRPASVLLLLDLSMSTGRQVDVSASSLLDREKIAAERIASAFDGARHRIALHGFASNGRSAVRYVKLKEFGTPYAAPQRQRLHALRPAWSTRIGAALRHAGHCLARETNASKSILLVTDGEPSDIDVFDPRYLLEDARHAVQTLAAQGIRTHCISLDDEAHAAVASIFGHGNCATLPHGSGLSATLERVLAKVAGR